MKHNFYALLAAAVLVPGLTFAHQAHAQTTPTTTTTTTQGNNAPGTTGADLVSYTELP